MHKRSFSVGALSDIGNVKKSNQDSILVKIGEDHEGEFGLFVVADGMGGLAYGDIASQTIVNAFKAWWDEWLSPMLLQAGTIDIKIIDAELGNLVRAINRKIYDHSVRLNEKIGSTMSMLFIYQNYFFSKAYWR